MDNKEYVQLARECGVDDETIHEALAYGNHLKMVDTLSPVPDIQAQHRLEAGPPRGDKDGHLLSSPSHEAYHDTTRNVIFNQDQEAVSYHARENRTPHREREQESGDVGRQSQRHKENICRQFQESSDDIRRYLQHQRENLDHQLQRLTESSYCQLRQKDEEICRQLQQLKEYILSQQEQWSRDFYRLLQKRDEKIDSLYREIDHLNCKVAELHEQLQQSNQALLCNDHHSSMLLQRQHQLCTSSPRLPAPSLFQAQFTTDPSLHSEHLQPFINISDDHNACLSALATMPSTLAAVNSAKQAAAAMSSSACTPSQSLPYSATTRTPTNWSSREMANNAPHDRSLDVASPASKSSSATQTSAVVECTEISDGKAAVGAFVMSTEQQQQADIETMEPDKQKAAEARDDCECSELKDSRPHQKYCTALLAGTSAEQASKALQGSHYELTRKLEWNTVNDFLFAYGVLTENERDEVESNRVKVKARNCLLEMMRSKSGDAFIVFAEALLTTKQDSLYEHLMKSLEEVRSRSGISKFLTTSSHVSAVTHERGCSKDGRALSNDGFCGPDATVMQEKTTGSTEDPSSVASCQHYHDQSRSVPIGSTGISPPPLKSDLFRSRWRSFLTTLLYIITKNLFVPD